MMVFGYGACMLSGYPFQQAKSFFSHMLAGLPQDKKAEAMATSGYKIVSLHRFTAVRAERHIRAQVLPYDPDVVVLQFGSSDVDCAPIHLFKQDQASFGRGGKTGQGSTPTSLSSAEAEDCASGSGLRLPGIMDQLRWFIATLLGFLFRPSPVTTYEDYLEAMVHMVDLLVCNQIEVIVLSPFPFAMRYTHRLAKRYTAGLIKRLNSRTHVTCVDCIKVLEGYPIRSILLSDGMHLSPFGHQVLGEHLSDVLKQSLDTVQERRLTEDRVRQGR